MNSQPVISRIDVRYYGPGWATPMVLVELACEDWTQSDGIRFVCVPLVYEQEAICVFEGLTNLLELKKCKLAKLHVSAINELNLAGDKVSTQKHVTAHVVVDCEGCLIPAVHVSADETIHRVFAEACLRALLIARQ